MERIIRFFVERHTLVNIVTAAVIALGLLNLLNAKIEGFPQVDLPSFIITAQLPGASARDVEAKITIPIEEALEEVDGLLHYTTVVTQNRSVTTVELDEETPREAILEKVAEEGITEILTAIPTNNTREREIYAEFGFRDHIAIHMRRILGKDLLSIGIP